jgi:trans-aconitate methyltransferase
MADQEDGSSDEDAWARWNGALYGANTAHHRQFDDAVLSGVDLAPDLRLLDLGCGVGDFTRRLAERTTDGWVVGVDADPDMIRMARAGTDPSLAERVRFEVVPAQRIVDGLGDTQVDGVFSVATLHWVPEADHPQVLRQIRQILRPGGFLRAEFGGRGQIAAVRAICDEEAARLGGSPPPWFFPDPQAYRALLADAGLDPAAGWVRLLHQRRQMPDAAAIAGWLDSQVLVGYDAQLPVPARNEFRRRAHRRVAAELRRTDGTFDQDYVRLDLLAHRPA